MWQEWDFLSTRQLNRCRVVEIHQMSKNEQTEMNIDSKSAAQLSRSAMFLDGERALKRGARKTSTPAAICPARRHPG